MSVHLVRKNYFCLYSSRVLCLYGTDSARTRRDNSALHPCCSYCLRQGICSILSVTAAIGVKLLSSFYVAFPFQYIQVCQSPTYALCDDWKAQRIIKHCVTRLKLNTYVGVEESGQLPRVNICWRYCWCPLGLLHRRQNQNGLCLHNIFVKATARQLCYGSIFKDNRRVTRLSLQR